MTYKEFRQLSPILPFMSMQLANSICYPFSPFISIFCIKKGISPNSVTLMMLVCGIIGGVLLAMPYAWCKLIAFFIYFLWYTFDLSDGEVARVSKKFSRGGKYLDWCSHLTCHSFFIVSMWLSLQQQGYTNQIVTLSAFCLLALELIGRDRIAMDTLYGEIANTPYHDWKPVSIPRYIYNIFVYFPNAVILYPLFLFFDIFFKLDLFCVYYIVWSFLYSLVMLRVFFMFVWRMYKSE